MAFLVATKYSSCTNQASRTHSSHTNGHWTFFCIVQGCSEQIAPSVWHSHMNLHVRGVCTQVQFQRHGLKAEACLFIQDATNVLPNHTQESHRRKCTVNLWSSLHCVLGTVTVSVLYLDRIVHTPKRTPNSLIVLSAECNIYIYIIYIYIHVPL